VSDLQLRLGTGARLADDEHDLPRRRMRRWAAPTAQAIAAAVAVFAASLVAVLLQMH